VLQNQLGFIKKDKVFSQPDVKGLCEVRATATEIPRGDRTLAKTFSIF